MDATIDKLRDKIFDIAKNNIPVEPVEITTEPVIIDDNSNSFVDMVSALMHSRNQAHVFHWQVTNPGSYAAHVALQKYYENIIDLLDDLVESYQGKNGIICNFKMTELNNFSDISNIIAYFNDLLNLINNCGEHITESYIKNQIDTIIQLIESTIYRLTNLS